MTLERESAERRSASGRARGAEAGWSGLRRSGKVRLAPGRVSSRGPISRDHSRQEIWRWTAAALPPRRMGWKGVCSSARPARPPRPSRPRPRSRTCPRPFERRNYGSSGCRIFLQTLQPGRILPGATITRLQADLNTIVARLQPPPSGSARRLQPRAPRRPAERQPQHRGCADPEPVVRGRPGRRGGRSPVRRESPERHERADPGRHERPQSGDAGHQRLCARAPDGARNRPTDPGAGPSELSTADRAGAWGRTSPPTISRP